MLFVTEDYTREEFIQKRVECVKIGDLTNPVQADHTWESGWLLFGRVTCCILVVQVNLLS